MSLEAALTGRSVSPASSGRSTPVPRTSRRAEEDGVHKGDKTFRKYAAVIERALSSWEISPEEWADYIAFLGRLLKAIQSHPRDVAVLPHSSGVASKLSQCMNPALPSGVHQKALEVYAYIFSTFGHHFLSDHLDDFFPGLSAVLSFASLSVRPALYDIIEEHIITLAPDDLRPLLKAILLSLLPALEEETSEDFDRAFRITEALERKFMQAGQRTIGEKNGFFWQCLFLAVITSPTRRQGALNFLAQKLPKFGCTADTTEKANGIEAEEDDFVLSKDAEAVVSPEPGLLIRAFVCGLSDPQVLTQRGFLDLLVTHLPLNSPLLQTRIRTEDLDRLVNAAMQVLLRREMSLNRRLWSWFLGPEPKSEASGSQSTSPVAQRGGFTSRNTNTQLEYFLTYGKSALERSVLALFKAKHTNAASQARPFRLCLSLMDRWEIGGSIVPEMFLPAIESAYNYSLQASAADMTDLVRSASLFFDSIEGSLIWSTILGLVDSAFEDNTIAIQRLDLCRWIIQHFNIKDEEMVTSHIPRCALFILAHVESTQDIYAPRNSASLQIASTLLEATPARALSAGTESVTAGSDSPRSRHEPGAVRHAISRIYHGTDQRAHDLDLAGSDSITWSLYSTITALTIKALRRSSDTQFGQATKLLTILHDKAPSPSILHASGLISELTSLLEQNAANSEILAFPTIASALALISALSSTPTIESVVSEADVARLESTLTPQAWFYLSPSRAKYHVEATRVMWQLQELTASEHQFEATLTSLLRPSSVGSTPNSHSPGEAARRFATLWNHSLAGNVKSKQGISGSLRRASNLSGTDVKQSQARQEILTEPLMLLMDTLSDPQDVSHTVVKSWLHSLPTLEQVYQIHFELLESLLQPSHDSQAADDLQRERDYKASVRGLEHVTDHFLAILKHGNEWVWECICGMRRDSEGPEQSTSGLVSLVQHCIRFICEEEFASQALERQAIDIVELALKSSDAALLKRLELDSLLIDRLLTHLNGRLVGSQSALLALLTHTLKLRLSRESFDNDINRPRSRNSISSKRPSTAGFKPSLNASSLSHTPTAPAKLLVLLRTAFSSEVARPYIDKWLEFLSNALPVFSDAIFSGLIPLVECLCKELDAAHAELIAMSQGGIAPPATAPESTIMALLEAVEMVLARAHTCLEEEEHTEPEHRPATQSKGLLGNVTSGVFKSEAPPSRSAHANSRLTVILTFQDAIRASLRLWIWGSHHADIDNFDKTSAATASYNALRVRNRTRHLLEQIFAVEPLESLEVVMANWRFEDKATYAAASLDLLHVLQGTRPKNVIPAILDALCSRANPSVLPSDRQSTQSIDLTALDVADFLSAYLRSTEDDAMDEVWPDCMAFLRDVLSNPLPYRQVLPALLLTVLLLAQKLDNTNFGEQRKMRKDLGDSFNRLLTAAFTTMPSGYIQDPNAADEQPRHVESSTSAVTRTSTSLIAALKEVTASVEVILETADRAASAMNTISSNLIGPLFRAKAFPNNITADTLDLLLQIAKKAPLAKPWKKELSEAFNDPRLLTSPAEIMETHWFPVIQQWSLHDKDRMPELLSRLAPPSSAGIMFGVGANAARLEADRRTQLNLRRICLLMLACPEDTFAMQLRTCNEKLAELFDATVSSSPSVAVKAELFMLCRSIVLSTSAIQLAPMWPVINNNLHAALASLLPSAANSAAFANLSLLQACKLLDLLIAICPDEFQLHEWLYVTDTIDAVYQPSGWDPSALSDRIAVAMASDGIEEGSSLVPPTPIASAQSGRRKPLLDSQSMSSRDDFKAMARDDFAHTVLQPFLSQLSMYAYEAVYGMSSPDVTACRRNLLEDLLDLSTIVE